MTSRREFFKKSALVPVIPFLPSSKTEVEEKITIIELPFLEEDFDKELPGEDALLDSVVEELRKLGDEESVSNIELHTPVLWSNTALKKKYYNFFVQIPKIDVELWHESVVYKLKFKTQKDKIREFTLHNGSYDRSFLKIFHR